MKRRIPIAVMLLSMSSCAAAPSHLDGFGLAVPSSDAVFFVVEPTGTRRLDHLITSALTHRGMKVTSVESEPHDYVVRHFDRWEWDMRMFLIDLRIDIRDAETNLLAASARSFQDSGQATGQTPASIVDNVVDLLLSGKPAELR